MKIFDSISKEPVTIKPLDKKAVRIYSCGPTVYNNLHIGNLSAFIYADVLRRAFSSNGENVTHVMNITDVDDKTIRDSKAQFDATEPMQALKLLTDKYTTVFMEDLQKTGCDTKAINFISAVETIPEMVDMIQKIIDNGIGYIAEDGVYFSVSKYIESGQKYGILQYIEIATSQSRISNDEYDKEGVSDFALWKAQAEGEPAWDATFQVDGIQHTMPGRPGWHIECSVMSLKLLGLPFDIHTGGIDLRFPHHENEIAQAKAAGYEDLASVFVHNNHMLVDGKKMSKSLGNFYTLRDVEKQGISSQAFRVCILSSHYSSESNFTWDIMSAAQNRYNHWQKSVYLSLQPIDSDLDIAELCTSLQQDLTIALHNNLDTVQYLALLDKFFTEITDSKIPKNNLSSFINILTFIEQSSGITFDLTDISEAQSTLISRRQAARANKDWPLSDQIRDELLSHSIELDDTPQGVFWNKINS